MTIVGFAENTHDSCITIATDSGRIVVHLELERFFGLKRYRVRSADVVARLVFMLLRENRCERDISLVVSRHVRETVLDDVVACLAQALRLRDVHHVDHLAAHAAFASVSTFDRALTVVLDGGGDHRVPFPMPNGEIYLYERNRLRRVGPLFDVDGNGIDGRAWSVVSQRLFGDLVSAGKVMGLAAYSTNPERYQDLLYGMLGQFAGWRYDNEGLGRLCDRLPGDSPAESADLAAALQAVFTERMIAAIRPFRHLANNLVLAGGCALNVLTNSAIVDELQFEAAFVPPCPGDEGQSLGAVLHHLMSREVDPHAAMPFLGRGSDMVDPDARVTRALAERLACGQVIAFHVGRPEIGPRALGHRSLLAVPSEQNRHRVSVEIKGREAFRPVAPVIRQDDAVRWFPGHIRSPFMSFATDSSQEVRAQAPGVVHADGTARLQTVPAATNPHLEAVLAHLDDLTGCPILINTSLNQAGRPICDTEQDTLELAVATPVDVAYINGELISLAE